MKKRVIFLITLVLVALVSFGVYKNLPLSKGKVENMIYKQAAVLLSYKNTNNPLIVALGNNADVKVKNVVKGSEGYIATCEVGNHNFASAYNKYMSDEYITTLNQFSSDFIKALCQEELVYSTVQVNVIKNSAGKYQVELTEKDLDAFTGGFITFAASYFNMNK